MIYKVYILHSPILSKFYVGISADVEKRLWEHLNPIHTKYTSQVVDWVVFLELECVSKAHALKVERFIKNMKSTKFIISLNEDADKAKSIVDKLAIGC